MSFGIVTYHGTNDSVVLFHACTAADVLMLPLSQESFGASFIEASSIETTLFSSNRINIWREFNKAGAGFLVINDIVCINGLLSRWLVLSSTKKTKSRGVSILVLRLNSQLNQLWMILEGYFVSSWMEFDGA